MSIEYPFRNYAFLYGASAKSEVVNYVRTECIPEEQDRLDDVLSDWQDASKLFEELEQAEIGEPEAIEVEEIPLMLSSRVQEFERDFLFKQSFSLLPYDFKLVEIDRLVASQRTVNLDYVELLKKKVASILGLNIECVRQAVSKTRRARSTHTPS